MLDVLGKDSVGTEELDVGTVGADLTGGTLLNVLGTVEGSETPLLGDNDLLATGELVLASPESLEGGGAVGVLGADGHEDLSDVDTGDGAVRLSPSTTHTGLKTIGTSARQHLVDTDDVEGVGTASLR